MKKTVNDFDFHTTKEKHVIVLKKINKSKYASRPAIFFDRDGVIIEDMHYISNPKDVKLQKGIKELLLNSHDLGWLNIVITNQSGIYRGFLNWEDYEKVTFKMLEILGMPNYIDGIYANSFEPCKVLPKNSWRKPNPNMIIKASNDFNVNLKESILVGDRLTDLIAGYSAGINKLVHVLTGHGREDRKDVKENFENHSDNINLNLIDNLQKFPLKNFLKDLK